MNSKIIILALLLAGGASARAQSTVFTYQGQLNLNGAPANGFYDLSFGLYAGSSGGSPVGTALTNFDVPVSDGLFTTALQFNTSFTGTNYWLNIAVRTNGSSAFSGLSPRQPLTATPYALYAANAGGVSGVLAATNLPAGVVTLDSSPDFTGTVAASDFAGSGTGLTNVIDSGAARKANNGSDFANNQAVANNVGVQVVPGPTLDWYTNINSATPAFPGQLALVPNGGSYPYLFNGLSTNFDDWLGSFRFLGVCQFGDRYRMHANTSSAEYFFFINGNTNQPNATAASNVLVLENENTNQYSAVSFQFAQSNNYAPGYEAGSIGVGNSGTLGAFSNALYIHASSVPINFTMAGRNTAAPYANNLIAYFDWPSSDFHYIDNNGEPAFNIRAYDGQVSVYGALTAGSLTVGGSPVALLNGNANFNSTVTASAFVGNGAGLTNLNIGAVSDTNAVQKSNNGSDFANLSLTRANLGGERASPDATSIPGTANIGFPGDFVGQIVVNQAGQIYWWTGGSWQGNFQFVGAAIYVEESFEDSKFYATNGVDNCLELRNFDHAHYSAARFVDEFGAERGAIGYGNTGAAAYPGINYFESYATVSPIYFCGQGVEFGGMLAGSGNFGWWQSNATNGTGLGSGLIFQVDRPSGSVFAYTNLTAGSLTITNGSGVIAAAGLNSDGTGNNISIGNPGGNTGSANFGTVTALSKVTTPAVQLGGGGPVWSSGVGSPQGVLTAGVGSLYTRTDGGAGTTLYVKESGTGNTGWAAK